jgi:hypothetical protein
MTWASLRRSFGSTSSASLRPADRPISAYEARPRRAFFFSLENYLPSPSLSARLQHQSACFTKTCRDGPFKPVGGGLTGWKYLILFIFFDFFALPVFRSGNISPSIEYLGHRALKSASNSKGGECEWGIVEFEAY